MSYIGITGYGAYIPRFRLQVKEIERSWGVHADTLRKSLCVEQKSVPGIDEDTATMAVESGKAALAMSGVAGESVKALFVGSESHPYAVKPTATIVAEALGLNRGIFSADLEFACKAGTSAMQVVYGMVKSGMVENGLAIGSDVAQAHPDDALECTASAGSGAFVIGNSGVIASIKATKSFATDTPDFWRRQNRPYPRHAGHFTGKPAYYRHLAECTARILEETGMRPSDFAQAVFHQPNGKFPVEAARMLGFSEKQMQQGLLVKEIGNCYTASSMIGMCAALDIAEPGQSLLLVSYGSGAGADSFVLETTNLLAEARKNSVPVRELVKRTTYVSYDRYMRHSKRYTQV